MADVDDDIEQQFFDPPRRHGVRRATMVLEMGNEEREAIRKKKGDLSGWLFYEVIVGILVSSVLLVEDIHEDDVKEYLYSFLGVNGLIWMLKTYFMYCTIEKRHLAKTEKIDLVLQLS